MSSELYDDDILLWSERQAELLRRHAADAPLPVPAICPVTLDELLSDEAAA
jgi:hypothetical protein